MTRGRWSNTAHLIAEDLTDAREQWITVFTRDRADLGPAHAGRLAAAEAARYARERSVERAPTAVGAASAHRRRRRTGRRAAPPVRTSDGDLRRPSRAPGSRRCCHQRPDGSACWS
jgi:exodeoxyribonuclease V alpha subunit